MSDVTGDISQLAQPGVVSATLPPTSGGNIARIAQAVQPPAPSSQPEVRPPPVPPPAHDAAPAPSRSDQDLAAQGQKETQQIPFGTIPVKEMRLLPHYNSLGATRPLGPGEAVRLPDGGITSEETYTVPLPTGKWVVIPGLWLVNGVPTHVTEDQATHLAMSSGLDWPYSFDTQEQADAYTIQREAVWEKTPQALDMTTAQPALWRQRQ